ncbi:MAG: hypothetical protein J2P20_17595 [Pseudonocardia sp.]|nr:hypothetical protein [Pseudonocardia sp.]MBO0873462.1 hypothetical protein [Pseudonocardia sp.]
MRIVDPTYGIAAREDVTPVARDGVPTEALCLFSNSKPGANDLLNGIGRRLTAERGMEGIGFASKPNAAAAADTVTIDRLAERYRMAVVAIGD